MVWVDVREVTGSSPVSSTTKTRELLPTGPALRQKRAHKTANYSCRIAPVIRGCHSAAALCVFTYFVWLLDSSQIIVATLIHCIMIKKISWVTSNGERI